MKKKIINISVYIFLLVFFFFSLFVNVKFNNVSFEQLIYSCTNSKGANYFIVVEGLIFLLINILIFNLIVFILFKVIKKKLNKYINIIFLIVILLSSFKLLNIDSYIINRINKTEIFDKYYVNPSDVEIKFPSKKRNLIYIYVESLEMSSASIKNGGNVEKSYIPNLEKLALENINFSNKEKLGGALNLSNTDWTIAALIAQTTGVPLKFDVSRNYDFSMKGVTALGDILKENGYNNYFMVGSDSSFGGRKDYFKSHGNYTIYDYITAKDEKLISDDYFVWWGYEDNKLFDFAKDKIIEIENEEEPFNFTILTVDTHFTDGYIDKSCDLKFDSKYANSFYCSDGIINEFISWLKKQDFYDNTTVIITGDHLTMQSNFYKNNNYERTVYNTFINTDIKPIKEKNRLFTTLDMFPTTLASLNVKIEGNKLGLGVNLFSKEKTLVEKLGYEKVENELLKKSNYYNKLVKEK